MNNEKSCYRFVFNCDPNFVKRTIDDYLRMNNYKLVQKKNATYFLRSDLLQGKRFFEYYFNGNMVIIYVYINTYKHPWPLDDAYVGSVPKQAYKEALVPLFSALDRLGNPDPYAQNTPVLQEFVSKNRNQKGNLAILSFFYATLNLLLSLFHISIYEFIFLVAGIYMAVVGLNSDKKGYAIGALCLMGFTVVILIMKFNTLI